MIETHTYSDGTQRVGCPPFPTLSPKEEYEAKLRAASAEPEQEPTRRGRPPKNKDAD